MWKRLLEGKEKEAQNDTILHGAESNINKSLILFKSSGTSLAENNLYCKEGAATVSQTKLDDFYHVGVVKGMCL